MPSLFPDLNTLIADYGDSLTRMDAERDLQKTLAAQAVTAAIRAHYFSLPGKTEEGWAEVLLDPRRYNYVWRHMLKHACGQDLDLQPFPPPSHLQHLLR